MSFKPTIIVLTFALGGLALVFGLEWKDRSLRLSSETHSRLVSTADLPIDQLTSITVVRSDVGKLVFERHEGGVWSQVEPFPHPMDPFSIRQLAVVATEVEVLDTVSPDEDDRFSPDAVGLNPPEAQVMYEWPGGSLNIDIGRRSLAGRAFLRRKDNPEFLVVSSQLHERVAEMDSREWRDRTIFSNVGIESDRIEWRQSDRSLVLVRDRKQWKMHEPAQTRLDTTARDVYMSALGRATVSGFILDQPGDLGKFGLATPVATLTVTTSRDGTPDIQTLQIGSRAGGGSEDRFGMITGRPVVVRISQNTLAALFPTANAIASPIPSGVSPADVKSITIRTPDSEVVLERNLEQWVAPKFGNVPVDPKSVNELLNQITTLRASAVELRPYPAELEVATVTLHGYDARAIDTVRIARDTSNGTWAMENGDNVLRLYPEHLSVRLRPEDFGLSE